ncbi:phosphate/phosphite/phosphonate ABC transporter substrate-binding protein [Robertmurraya yapensis]|uniref:Phosphate/phosphite/phosphonate ABC transporter substrate-binding protein n=2 Tax=Bacillaceae TaxID=186817 RepID=A0A431W196_9BACI|nr:phosphate/phosphite/phosphonate ABC transporter substrate-binding protein [Bacillus yapensis]RTR29146.1 phosphate/phosphite/phosphonate ABC transporter substrate-binding protein [Bacillus yapensis]TKS94751.1 phosphate/phosphite/phosphonate ABC transporter substrate-binding protein [Bacillus yapensis]
MKKSFLFLLSLVILFVAGCSSSANSEGSSGEDKATITIAWLPNESGADLTEARDAIGKVIEEKTGKEVEHQTTTDYIVAIEAVANGNADMAFLGAQGYIEAKNKNDKVEPLVVPTGASGTLEDAVYYSWLAVEKDNVDEYKDGEEFAIDNIQGKKFSFVSNSSTSGFKVPSTGIVEYFSQKDDFKDLTAEDLLEGGDDKFFSEVLYGGSHQGSAVNLLSGKADVAAFCDTCVNNYVELAEGDVNRPGAIYKVKTDAAEPFNTVVGKEFQLISVTPVLNAPFVINTDNISEDLRAELLEIMTSDDITNNEKVFVPEDSEFSGLFKKTADERLVEVEDEWFDPIRELSK